MYVYRLCLLFDFATKKLQLATIVYHLVDKWRLQDFVNFEPCNGRSNPEVVGSIPTEVKDFFFTSCGYLIPFTRANTQWVIHGSISTLIYTSELILCFTI